jgi:hypothetical protein
MRSRIVILPQVARHRRFRECTGEDVPSPCPPFEPERRQLLRPLFRRGAGRVRRPTHRLWVSFGPRFRTDPQPVYFVCTRLALGYSGLFRRKS